MDNAPRVCIIWAVITIAALVAEVVSTSDSSFRTDGTVVTLTSDQTMQFRFADDDVRELKLHKGDSVRVLGIHKLHYMMEYLVETTDGNRGWLQADQLPVRVIVRKGKFKGDTVRLTSQYRTIGTERHPSGYYINGSEDHLQAEQFVPDFPEWEKYSLEDNTATSIMTVGKLRDMNGNSLGDIEAKVGPAYQVLHLADSTLAQFRMSAISMEDGKTYRPTITFDADSNAVGMAFEYRRDRGDWLLRNLPGAKFVINMPLTRMLTRSSIYVPEGDLEDATLLTKVWVWCLVILQILVYAVWMFVTASLPVLVIGWLIRFPRLFAFLDDKPLKILMLVVTAISFYCWSVALLAWGMFWPFLVLLFLTDRYFYTLAACVLCQMPHIRCPQCRRLYTIRFDHDEFVNTTYEKGSDIVKGKMLGLSTSRYQTWLQVTTTTTYSDWSVKKESHRENVQNHKVEHRTYEMLNYELTYKVDHYLSHYICGECGHEETMGWAKYTVVDRKYVGSTTMTEDWEV